MTNLRTLIAMGPKRTTFRIPVEPKRHRAAPKDRALVPSLSAEDRDFLRDIGVG